ncbi:hypothetical protein L1987_54520 [Smallanthus sonchifolius]|uniref:Uncharacterized protein n=1 Tax=Smallanthus sonchifolius TaxID=185202 RepID=A0ACB9E7M9_9ASTR|nr:hypothetical protein L1987_54520 [Smallanthus sonchifolius]
MSKHCNTTTASLHRQPLMSPHQSFLLQVVHETINVGTKIDAALQAQVKLRHRWTFSTEHRRTGLTTLSILIGFLYHIIEG